MDWNLPQAAHTAASLLNTPPQAEELEHRLGLYQVFTRLYEQHRGLLEGILDLENLNLPGRIVPRYVIGMREGQHPYLMTNILEGETQRLLQPNFLWVIGRAKEIAFPLDDRCLSRYHAMIRLAEPGFELIDLKSTNGTFVNGEPVKYRKALKEGDRVRLGSLAFTFYEGTSQPTMTQGLTPQLQQELGVPLPSLGASLVNAKAIARPPGEPQPGQPLPPGLEETWSLLRNALSNIEGLSADQRDLLLDRLHE
jgi:hypothetical protein